MNRTPSSTISAALRRQLCQGVVFNPTLRKGKADAVCLWGWTQGKNKPEEYHWHNYHLGRRKERRKEDLTCMKWSNFTSIILEGVRNYWSQTRGQHDIKVIVNDSHNKKCHKITRMHWCYYTFPMKFQHWKNHMHSHTLKSVRQPSQRKRCFLGTQSFPDLLCSPCSLAAAGPGPQRLCPMWALTRSAGGTAMLSPRSLTCTPRLFTSLQCCRMSHYLTNYHHADWNVAQM